MKLFTPLLLFVFVFVNYSQQAPQKSEAEVRALIKKSNSKDFKENSKAAEKLSALGTKYIPILFKMVKKGKPCERVDVASLIVDLDKKNKEIIPILVSLGRGGNLLSLFNLQEEFLCRRKAFFLLAVSADGIRELTKILKEGDSWEKESVIFAFDDLTETTDYPDDILQVMKDAVPIIAQAGNSKNKVLREMSDEVLSQIINHSPEELTEIAKKYVK